MKLSHGWVVLGCLLLGSCRPAERSGPTTQADFALRSFLGVRTIQATYELPQGKDHYALKLLHFEDGKLVKRGAIASASIPAGDKRSVAVQLLWGRTNGEARASLVMEGGTTQFSGEFLEKLDGSYTSGGSAAPVADHDGYKILGFAQSYLEQNGNRDTVSYGDFAGALKHKRFVGALAIRTFASRDDAAKD